MKIGIAVIFFLLGIILQATLLRDLEDVLANVIKKNRMTIRIKMQKVGTDSFHVRSIKKVTGLKPFKALVNQTITLQDLIINLIDKINYYGLTDFYDKKLQIQTDLVNYCKNLEKLNIYIRQENALFSFDSSTAFNDSVISRAAKEIQAKNSIILKDLYVLDETINNTIDTRGLKLFPDPQP